MSTEKTKILLVEDDPNLGTLLQEYLEAKDYAVKLAHNGKEGYDLFCKQEYDLCLLDVMMPLKDGFTLAKEIRMTNKQVPIIFLTAKSMKEDAIEGFTAGADDYITKPFSMEELLLRIQAVLRRSMKTQVVENSETEFTIGKYRFNTEKQTLSWDDSEIKLTTKEVQLLRLLVLNRNEVVDRGFTLKTIWHDDNYFNSRSMDVYITKLRKYLKQDPKVEIVNVHGKGFKLLVNS
jgi:two-component system, OmpR family, response regulator